MSDWLATLYEDHGRRLLCAAWVILRRQELAEDALHTAFARMAGLASRPRDPKLYAFRAVRNAAFDLKAQSLRHRCHCLDEQDGFAYDLEDPKQREALAEAARALALLDDDSREVVQLHLQANLTFREIGIVLEQPWSTVASRYRRALVKLRQELGVCHE